MYCFSGGGGGTVAGTAPQVRWVHRLTSSLPPPLPQEPQEIGQPRMRPASRSLPGPPPGRCAERTLGHGPNRSPVGQSPPDHSYSAPSLGGWVGPWCIAVDWMVCGQQAPPPPPPYTWRVCVVLCMVLCMPWVPPPLYTIDPMYFCTTTRPPPPSGPPPPPPLHYSRVVSRLNGNHCFTIHFRSCMCFMQIL